MVCLQAALPGEGDPITALNASLDGMMLAVQRGTAFLQFIHLTSSKIFVQVLLGSESLAHDLYKPQTCHLTYASL